MKLALALLLLTLPAATPEITHFRYRRPLQNLPQQAGQACLPLDAELYAHAAPQLADLRLYRDGRETPYAIRQTAPVESSVKSIAPLNLGQRGGHTVFDAALDQLRYSDVELAVSGQDFIATVAVSGSRAQTGTETSLGSYTIFDLTGQRLGRSTVLHLPESDFPYLHFRIDGPIAPAAVAGLSVVQLPVSSPAYQTVAATSDVTPKGHTTVVQFTVPAHVPVDRIVVIPGPQPPNFSRNVQISISPEAQTPAADPSATLNPIWPTSTSGNLLRIHSTQNGHRIDEENLSIAAPYQATSGQTARWTISIDNGDDAPLSIQSVQLQMRQADLCFESAAGAAYTLLYGDPALSAPRYDYTSLFIPQSNAAQLSAAPEQPNPNYQPRPDQRPFTERHPALLWIGLIAVIALLGWIALRSAKPSPPLS